MRSYRFDGNAAIDINSEMPNFKLIEGHAPQRNKYSFSSIPQEQQSNDRYNSFEGVEISGSRTEKILMGAIIGVGVFALFFFSFFFGV